MAKKSAKRRTARKNAQRRAERKQDGDFLKVFKLPEGAKRFQVKTSGPKRIDVIGYDVTTGDNPYADKGDFHYERTFYTHRGIGINEDSVVCPKMTYGKPCPICEYQATLKGDEDREEEYKSLKPKERQLWNVVDLSNADLGVQIWEVSYFLFGKKLDSEIANGDEDDEFEVFSDWDGGKTLKMNFEEKKFAGQTFYDVTSINFKDRSTVYDESTGAHDLDKLLICLSYGELQRLFDHSEPVTAKVVDDDDDDDDDEVVEEKPKPKAKAKKKKKPEPEPEEEEEDDEEEEEEEDDDTAEADDDDDDDEAEEVEAEVVEEEEEEEEEEEAPKPKAKAKAKSKKKPEPKEDDDGEEDDGNLCPHGHTWAKGNDSTMNATTVKSGVTASRRLKRKL